MHERVFRAVALLGGAAGIAGMIATSIAGSTGGALSFGLLCAAAALVLLVYGVVQRPAGEIDRLRATELEDQVAELVGAGVEETKLRRLIRLARGLEM